MTDLQWMRPRLAELCGLKLEADDGDTYISDTSQLWRPDEDVAQAVRALEALPERHFKRMDQQDGFWTVGIWTGEDGGHRCGQAASLARAICIAIAASLGWTEGDVGRGKG